MKKYVFNRSSIKVFENGFKKGKWRGVKRILKNQKLKTNEFLTIKIIWESSKTINNFRKCRIAIRRKREDFFKTRFKPSKVKYKPEEQVNNNSRR